MALMNRNNESFYVPEFRSIDIAEQKITYKLDALEQRFKTLLTKAITRVKGDRRISTNGMGYSKSWDDQS